MKLTKGGTSIKNGGGQQECRTIVHMDNDALHNAKGCMQSSMWHASVPLVALCSAEIIGWLRIADFACRCMHSPLFSFVLDDHC